ncbi:MAG: oligoendopeptidase F [Tissierellia bacterium]|jgi:oligoendopeptidase F|nr:oligoendopeptidase F [Tissierellia bacterium]
MDKNKELLGRKEVPLEHTWDLESLFKNQESWDDEYELVKKLAEEFELYKGKATLSSDNLYKALVARDNLYRRGGNLAVFTHMKLDEDTTNNISQGLSDKAMNLYVEVNEKTSFLEPEILLLDTEQLKEFVEEKPELKLYSQFLDDLLRQKSHILSAREESILAQIGEFSNAPQKIFSMLDNADLKFPNITDGEGKEIQVTHGNFIPLMESKDRQVRKAAFEAVYSTYRSFKNTYASILDGDLKKNIFNSKIRNFNNTREASLSSNNIPVEVYDNLIVAIHDNLDSMHKYMDIRKRALGLEELHMYDLYTPIVKEVDFKIPYREAVELIKTGLHPLGKDYSTIMDEAFRSRWIDIYENKGKRSGAYSSGSYDSKPFILLNYHDTLDSAFTLAHELGHSIHSYFTRKTQPFVYGNYSIFVAEVASTANETLLLDHMLNNVKDKNQKLYLLNHYLESFRTTVFRQTMFAEFELIINQHLEAGGALTADYLCGEYKKLNHLYYGPNVIVDEDIEMEWARIPHFYYNYYVFQYATGFSAAVALSEKILKEGDNATEKYLEFLKSGESDYPINVLKKAGVDMTTKEPVNNAMALFRKLVEEMDSLI